MTDRNHNAETPARCRRFVPRAAKRTHGRQNRVASAMGICVTSVHPPSHFGTAPSAAKRSRRAWRCAGIAARRKMLLNSARPEPITDQTQPPINSVHDGTVEATRPLAGSPARSKWPLVLLATAGAIGIYACVRVFVLEPAVEAAREQARRTQCANNLKQIASALLEYKNRTDIFRLPAPWMSLAGLNGLASGGTAWPWHESKSLCSI